MNYSEFLALVKEEAKLMAEQDGHHLTPIITSILIRRIEIRVLEEVDNEIHLMAKTLQERRGA